MKIGILVTSIGNFGEKGYYNAQEIGLAKELGCLAEEVNVYRLIAKEKEKQVMELQNNVSMTYLPAKAIGSNGIPEFDQLDDSIDVLICFSDTQICFSLVYFWAKKKKIAFVPYAGVLDSHSTSRIWKMISKAVGGWNRKIYQRCDCLAKTPFIEKKLREYGVKSVTLAPVGLDQNLLKKNYADNCITDIKKKHGYTETDKILLFVGRLEEEKQPLEMLEIFQGLFCDDSNYRLLMIGNGSLKEKLEQAVVHKGLQAEVRVIDKVANRDMWEFYRIADCFVNLNKQEIFGMAILEAMYYGCKVVAWKAPGPEYIIENSVSGWVAENEAEICDHIKNEKDVSENAHQRIEEHFTWKETAKIIYGLLEEVVK